MNAAAKKPDTIAPMFIVLPFGRLLVFAEGAGKAPDHQDDGNETEDAAHGNPWADTEPRGVERANVKQQLYAHEHERHVGRHAGGEPAPVVRTVADKEGHAGHDGYQQPRDYLQACCDGKGHG